jgi:protein-tyrosine phosphatase
VIDLHSHILPGVDDGPETMAGSLQVARAAVADGIEVVAATPHVREDYPTTAEVMERRLGELRAALDAAGVPLEARPGGEVALERLALLAHDELERFGLGGNPRYLLLEFPYYGWPLELPTQVFSLTTRAVTPVLAHPERNAEVQTAPERLRPLVEQGALVQLTAASVDGRLGARSHDAALALLELRLAHLLASDAHAPDVRGVGLTNAAAAVGDGELARWLTRDVPAAMVAGEQLPERPAGRRRRRWSFRRSRLDAI